MAISSMQNPEGAIMQWHLLNKTHLKDKKNRLQSGGLV